METKIMKINPNSPDPSLIEEAASYIRRGDLVGFPTETVYGLGGDARQRSASRKIYQAKGRPSDNPLIVHIADMDSLYEIAKDIPENALLLAQSAWPGPLTMIFKKTDKIPLETTGGLNTIAVRMPGHKIALELIKRAGGFIAAPSANISGRPSPTLASHVYEDMKGKIPCIIDGGKVGIGIESTIVDFTEERPTILRPGFLNPKQIETVIGFVKVDEGLLKGKGKKPKAPGMKYRHYAPRAELTIVEGDLLEVVYKIRCLTDEGQKAGKKVGVIGSQETIFLYEKGVVKNIGSRSDEIGIAGRLYRILREFDEEEVDCIYSEAFQTPDMGEAIMNRLLKAAGHRVIKV